MTTADRAKQMAEDWHCPFCPFAEFPDMRCRGNIDGNATEIAALLDLLVEAREIIRDTRGTPERPVLPLIERIDKVLGEP